ncbi:MAG: hypothetical protein ACKO0M_17450 [Cyanobium sp.]
MAFYSPDAAMGQVLTSLATRAGAGEADGAAKDLAITWIRYPRSLLPDGGAAVPVDGHMAGGLQGGGAGPAGRGASWQGGRLQDPGDLVQLMYLIAAERWLQRDLLPEEAELRRALEAMVREGSHDATSFVVDRLSGTTSGPSLPPHRWEAWREQRQLVGGWLASLGWPELAGCQALQKTWNDGPYGREREGFGEAGEWGNRCSSEGLARLLEAVLAGTLISPPACQRLRGLLADPVIPAGPTALHSALGPARGALWGMARSGSRGIRLALYAEAADATPTLLVLLAGAEWAASSRGAVVGRLVELLCSERMAAAG